MKIKRQFIILSTLIISVPILCSAFIIIHTYIHSPNRYLLKGSLPQRKIDIPLLSDEDLNNLETSLKLLPQEVEAVLCRTDDFKILYSSIPEIEVGKFTEKDDIWNFAAKTSDKYFYQFSKIPAAGPDILLITRLSLNRITSESRTKIYLKILLAVITITIISLILILFISKTIFDGLKKIEKSSTHLAEGQLDKPISSHISEPQDNEFQRIMNSLEKMRRELLEMQASKNRFITGISHDLRTPVAVIRGYTEAIKDNVISEKADIQNSMDLIEHKTIQLEEMIDTLLNFMKLNNKEIHEKLVLHSITTLINDFAKYAEVTVKVFKRNVSTDVNLPQNIEIPINEQLVHRAFENLLSNAIRYTRENDEIRIISYLKNEKNKNYIFLEIHDTGYGIDKKDLDYIFDIFYRGTNSRQEEGMGIGLAVVKSIINTHGWNISVTSKKNKGTCFTIKIPY